MGTLFIFAASTVELLLEQHTKEPLQWIPFFLCALGVIVVGIALARQQRSTLMVLRESMVIIMLGSLLVIGLHMLGNYSLVRDLHPQTAVIANFITSLNGAESLLRS